MENRHLLSTPSSHTVRHLTSSRFPMHQPDYLRLKLPRTVSATSDAIKLVTTDHIAAVMKSITSAVWSFLSILFLFTKSDMKTILIPTVSLGDILYYS
jgi:hypothetical protein